MKPILNVKSFTIVRTTAPLIVNGRAIPGTETTVPITANTQPAGGALRALPEARQMEDLVRFFTATEIFDAGHTDSGTIYNADQIIVRGARYEVFKIDQWPGHYECFASRQLANTGGGT